MIGLRAGRYLSVQFRDFEERYLSGSPDKTAGNFWRIWRNRSVSIDFARVLLARATPLIHKQPRATRSPNSATTVSATQSNSWKRQGRRHSFSLSKGQCRNEIANSGTNSTSGLLETILIEVSPTVPRVGLVLRAIFRRPHLRATSMRSTTSL